MHSGYRQCITNIKTTYRTIRIIMSLLTPRPTYAPFEYPQAYKYWELQQQSHWLHNEISMASDINDWKMILTDVEKNVIGHILKGFTQSEIFIQEYWSQMVAK